MEENISQNDIDRVGLSDDSRGILDELVADGFFKDNLTAYRLATSLSIYNKVDIANHHVTRSHGHMYLISQIDPNGVFAVTISELFPNYSENKYRALEKLADIGVPLLKQHMESNGSVIFWE
ncbi:hypothetical protein N9J51_03160 [Alphaproteobacteria bacterium]|nr:hypothetical protein [Alphaproteobacteria bacterium]